MNELKSIKLSKPSEVFRKVATMVDTSSTSPEYLCMKLSELMVANNISIQLYAECKIIVNKHIHPNATFGGRLNATVHNPARTYTAETSERRHKFVNFLRQHWCNFIAAQLAAKGE